MKDCVRIIDIALTRWLKKYEFDDVYVIGLQSSFYYNPQNNGIAYALLSTDPAAEAWERLMEELKCPYRIDNFYTSFLHELGHDQTLHLLDEDEIRESEDTTQYLKKDESLDEFEANMIYFHLPREIIATQWAVDFISHNAAAVKELVDTTSVAIRQYYSALAAEQ